ncbi:MAG: hypothetical protein DWQ35_20815 [Planctomycetota bacterium]|nr:MAG: hypothetical protein DWQ35_20815 [Planctomycetota bacterium]REK26458.1 MAG: hypothetical protein DWQ42_09025 [Planctomycetota bacterium]REK38705.1 MAG: hypothetical protein DWQ46_19950 [Planctomycetota bacterium]
MIGKRIRVEYFDHHDTFATFLPRTGFIERKFSSEHCDDWYLIRLDEPFDFRVEVDDFNHRNIYNSHFLIRSRWQGLEIGEAEPTSVFILLIPDMSALDELPVDLEACHHVAWGMAHTV